MSKSVSKETVDGLSLTRIELDENDKPIKLPIDQNKANGKQLMWFFSRLRKLIWLAVKAG